MSTDDRQHETSRTQVDSLVLGAGTALVTAGATLTVNSALPGVSLIFIGLMLMGFALVPHLRVRVKPIAPPATPDPAPATDGVSAPGPRPSGFTPRVVGLFVLVSVLGSIFGGGATFFLLRSTAALPVEQTAHAESCAGDPAGAERPVTLASGPLLATVRVNNARTGFLPEDGPIRAIALESIFPVSGTISGTPAIAEGMAYVGTSSGLVYSFPVSGEPNPKWVFRTRGAVYSSPTIANGAVYVTSEDGCLYALDALSGAVAWTYDLGLPVSSSATVVDRQLFVGAGQTDSPRGAVTAIDALSGERLWSYETQAAVYSAPSVVDGIVYFGVWSKQGDSVVALSAATGEKKWGSAAGDEVVGAIAVAEGTAYFGAYDGLVYALYAGTSMEKWRAMAWDGSATFDGNKLVYASPAVDGERLYVSSFFGKLYAFDLTSGERLWEALMGRPGTPTPNLPRPRSSPLAARNAIFVGGSSGYVYAFAPDTGEELWKFATAGPVSSSPMLKDGRLYVGVADDDGTLIALAGESG